MGKSEIPNSTRQKDGGEEHGLMDNFAIVKEARIKYLRDKPDLGRIQKEEKMEITAL